MILYIDNIKDYNFPSKKIRNIKNQNVPSYKVSKQKSVAFPYTNND